MSKDPAFLFYHQDFFTGVSDMTNEETGAYIKCMCIQASKNGISEKHMSIICQSSEVHNLIKSKFVLNTETNLLENLRLKTEIEKRKKYSESRSNNRKKGLKDKEQSLNTSKSYDKHMENENENEIEIESKIKKGVFDLKNSLIDFGFDENLVAEWLKVRKTKKATNTETAFKKFINQVKLVNAPINEILELCVAKSWSGFEAEWFGNIQKEKSSAKKENQSGDLIHTN